MPPTAPPPAGTEPGPPTNLFQDICGVLLGVHPRGACPRWAPPVCAGYFGIVTVAICFVSYNAWSLPLLVDNQHYFYIAERAASGVPPHVSVFDPKPHASTLLSAAAMKAGRVVGLSDARSGRLLSIAVTALSVALAWLLGWRLSGSTLGGHLAALFMLSYGEFLYYGSMGMRPKVFLVCFALACGWLLSIRRPLLAGIAGGLCFLCWQPGLVFFGAAGLGGLLSRKPIRNAMWIAAGGVIPVVVYEAYFALHGALADQWFQMIVFPAKYMADRGGGFQGFAESTRELLFAWNEWYRVYGSPIIALLSIPAGITLVAARPRKSLAFLRDRPEWVFLVSAGLISLAFTFRNHQGGPDLFFNLPTVACAAAAALLALRDAFRPLAWRLAMLLVCLGVAGGTIFEGAKRPWHYMHEILDRSVRGLSLDNQMDLAKEVRRWMDAGHTVYVTGSTHLLGMIDRENYVKYGLLFIRMEDYLTKEVHPFYLERDGELPDIIVIGRRPFEAFINWLPKEYSVVPQSQIPRDFWKDHTQICVIHGPRGAAAYQTIINRP